MSHQNSQTVLSTFCWRAHFESDLWSVTLLGFFLQKIVSTMMAFSFFLFLFFLYLYKLYPVLAFKKLLKYNWHTVFVLDYNILLQHLYTLYDHHHKFSNHLSPYKIIIILLAFFPMLYITSLYLLYFLNGSLYLLLRFTFFTHSPTTLPSGKHQLILCIYESLSIFCCSFVVDF